MASQENEGTLVTESHAEEEDSQSGKKKKKMDSARAEIDTSAPFESVKEAASRFGGFGFWKPHSLNHSPSAQHDNEGVDITKVEEQAVQLEKDLIAKERETLNVLKELEATKSIVEELKLKLQKEASEINGGSNPNFDTVVPNPALKVAEKENRETFSLGPPSSAPGYILLELKQAKLNLTRTTNDLSEIRATVESFKKKIEKERLSLEKTRQRLSFNSSKVSSLEEDLNETRHKLEHAYDSKCKGDLDNPVDISRELQRLSSETEEYKKVGEAAKREVLKAMSNIEQTKARIRTAEIRLVAAKKMKEAARATEAVALAEMKALSSSALTTEGVTLSFKEYTALTSKAQDAEEASRRRVIDAMVMVDEANVSKSEILKRVEEATDEVKTSKRVLEEALNKVEAANRAKLSVEEALRKWRSENGQKRRSVQNSTRFKNSSYASHHRKESHLLDVNGSNIINNDVKPVLRPTLSIGQILSRKLLLTDEFENGMKAEKSCVKPKRSLGQMLSSRPNGGTPIHRKTEMESGHKQLSSKRKKFGFARLSILMRKQTKKKKKQNPYSGCRNL